MQKLNLNYCTDFNQLPPEMPLRASQSDGNELSENMAQPENFAALNAHNSDMESNELVLSDTQIREFPNRLPSVNSNSDNSSALDAHTKV